MSVITSTVMMEVKGSFRSTSFQINEYIKEKVTELVKNTDVNAESLPKIAEKITEGLNNINDIATSAKASRDQAFSYLEKITLFHSESKQIIAFIDQIKSERVKTAVFAYIESLLHSEFSELNNHIKTYDSWVKGLNEHPNAQEKEEVRLMFLDILIDILEYIPEFSVNMEKIMTIVQ
jgi:uncharacterized coiled-coil DUF342 family protein